MAIKVTYEKAKHLKAWKLYCRIDGVYTRDLFRKYTLKNLHEAVFIVVCTDHISGRDKFGMLRELHSSGSCKFVDPHNYLRIQILKAAYRLCDGCVPGLDEELDWYEKRHGWDVGRKAVTTIKQTKGPTVDDFEWTPSYVPKSSVFGGKTFEGEVIKGQQETRRINKGLPSLSVEYLEDKWYEFLLIDHEAEAAQAERDFYVIVAMFILLASLMLLMLFT